MKSKRDRDYKYDETRPMTSDSSSASSNDESQAQFIVETVYAAPDGGWGWVVCFASFMCFVVLDGMLFTYGVLFVEFLDYFEQGKGKTALVGSVFMGMSLFLGPFTSAMVNLWGLRVVSMTGAVIASVSFAFSVFAPNLEVLTFTYGFMGGLGVAMVYIPSILVVGFYFDKKRATANGITSSGSGFGAFIFSPLCKYLIDLYTWKGAMLILSGVTLNCLVFCSLYRPLKAVEIIRNINDKTCEYDNDEEDEGDVNNKEECGSLSNSYLTLNGKVIQIPQIRLSTSSIFNGDDRSRSTDDVTSKMPKSQTHDLLRLVQTKRHFEMQTSNQNMQMYTSQHLAITSKLPQAPFKLCNSSGNICFSENNESPVFYKQITLKPSDKKDVYYSGSLQRINSCTLHDDKQKDIVSVYSVRSDIDVIDPPKHSKFRVVINSCIEVTGARLLGNPVFWLIVLANVMWTTHSTILTILPHHSIEQGVSESNAANLLSFIGFANIIARILMGWLSNHERISVIWVNITALFVGGCSCLLMPYVFNYTGLAALAVVFGSCMATWTSLRPIILVEILGLDHLTNAFGLLAMFQGFSFSIGPPIAGMLYDATSSYTVPFLLAGAAFTTSGIIFIIISRIYPCLNECAGHQRDCQKINSNIA